MDNSHLWQLPIETIIASEADDQLDGKPLSSLLKSSAFAGSEAVLPLALGFNERGTPVVLDLARCPHLLIGGTTGSGKSVAVHAMLSGLIHARDPQSVQLLLVDTKRLELPAYRAVPHLRYRVIVRADEAMDLLEWVAMEVVDRAALLEVNDARDIAEFNAKIGELVLVNFRRLGASPNGDLTPYNGGALPRLVVVIDDLADLAAADPAVHDVLNAIAQRGRATGVHLICVTQRPSVAVVAGDVKSLFPTRMAFRLPARIDSRMVLDRSGAEVLPGSGAFLLVSIDQPTALRGRTPMVARGTVGAIGDWYSSHPSKLRGHESDILEAVRQVASRKIEGGDLPFDERDTLFREGAEVVINAQQGSTALLQRRLKIGYGRAVRIIDQLVGAGVLGPSDGPRGHDVLAGLDDLDEICEKISSIRSSGQHPTVEPRWPGMRELGTPRVTHFKSTATTEPSPRPVHSGCGAVAVLGGIVLLGATAWALTP